MTRFAGVIVSAGGSGSSNVNFGGPFFDDACRAAASRVSLTKSSNVNGNCPGSIRTVRPGASGPI